MKTKAPKAVKAYPKAKEGLILVTNRSRSRKGMILLRPDPVHYRVTPPKQP